MFDLKKTFEKVVRGAVASAVAVACTFLAKHVGLDLTPEQQLTLVAFLTGAIAGLTNFLKHRLPNIFGWL